MRYLTTTLLMALAVGTWAQSGSFVYFESPAPMTLLDVREAMQAVADAAPGSEVFHSDDLTILQVRTTASTNEAALRAAITGAGIQLLPNTPGLQAALGGEAPADARPVYVLTGDAAGDRARYAEAVAAWNAAHPDDTITLPLEPEN